MSGQMPHDRLSVVSATMGSREVEEGREEGRRGQDVVVVDGIGAPGRKSEQNAFARREVRGKARQSVRQRRKEHPCSPATPVTMAYAPLILISPSDPPSTRARCSSTVYGRGFLRLSICGRMRQNVTFANRFREASCAILGAAVPEHPQDPLPGHHEAVRQFARACTR
jgi:hypothetical protein